MIVYRPGAMRDLRGIALWYASHRPEAIARFFARLRATIERIEQQPASLHLVTDAGGVRKPVVLQTILDAGRGRHRKRRAPPRRTVPSGSDLQGHGAKAGGW
jgi:hypothetical protein